ncbi:MAG: AI-2E family transporter [Candidatus Eremiobacteraeota bacterium]|nr:AI-2E family transporter [Candidatus Eremiobacteraeota bacterium]
MKMLDDKRALLDPVAQRLIRPLLIVALLVGIGTLLWMVAAVFDRVHSTMVVIIFAILFSYAVFPPIKWLAKRGIPVPIAGIVVYAALAVVILGAIAWLTPAIAAQAQDLTKNFPHIVAQAQREIADPKDAPLLERLPAGARDAIAKNTGKAGAIVGGVAAGFGANALQIVSGTTAAIVDIALVLGLTLLIIGDLAEIQAFGSRLVPRAYRRETLSFMADVDKVIGAFVRGQVLLAVAVAVAGTLVLVALGVPYALLLGLLAGLVSIVPIVGPIAAVVPVIVVAFLTVGLFKTIVVVVLYGIILLVQQNVLIPIVVAKAVGVTPLVIFVALLLGSEAFGILGALLSIPIAGVLRVAAERLFPVARDGERDLLT